MPTVHPLSFATLLLLAPVLTLAQPAANAPQQPHRITIDAVALDNLGHPVRGLDAHDFTVTDNGQAQKLAGFQAFAGPSHVVIVLDTINTGFEEVSWERQQLTEFMNQDGARLKYPATFAIMTESGLKMMSGYSQDGHALLTALQQFDTALRPIRRSAGFAGGSELLEMSLGQIGQVAAVEGSLPGRKMMLVMSPGWPMLPGAGNEEDGHQRAWVFYTLVNLANGMRESNVAIYSLNPYEEGRSNPYYYKAFVKDVKRSDQAEYPFLALPALAEHTGGRAIIMGRDILGELNAAMRDAGPYYELSFDEPPADRPNEFHELRVTTDKPGLTVRTSSGYYANPQRPAGKLVAPSNSAAPLGSN